MVKRCSYCGRFFIPDPRVGSRQKACGQPECKRERKRQAQEIWVERNPGYFRGRYPYVKEWRQRRRKLGIPPGMIQDEIPCKKPLGRLVLLIPAGKMGVIQDEIRLRRLNGSTFCAYGG